ncbi:hypothetical protein AU252_05195 [Pseudarthrobacter sulfonivorans]|uniref:Uncharacterized protein n=1 Tax=Pseudarthrobacter sulfonivorans TaxID=121292 RepID=A0A0U3NUW5_9MICC|nr:hypothetical protein AU252_05195 [Pseudarthrobacter sulfonivorans]
MMSVIPRFTTGVWNFSLSPPKTAWGRTKSRPIAYIRRGALACVARPESKYTTRPAWNKAPNSCLRQSDGAGG